MADITNTLEQRARELLAAEYERDERHDDARMLRDGLTCNAWSIALRAIEAALRLSAGEDWVLVPREPTDKMLHALSKDWDSTGNRTMDENYAAMLAAAPRHETGEG